MGRSRSRRGRGKSGGQGSGGSGKGKGTGGSRGRSSGTRGGQGKGGSGSGKGTGGSRGRSNNTRGGQSKANRNQNKKARRTINSVSKALGNVGKKVSKGFSIGKAAYGKAFRGLAANAATHVANSQYNKQLQQANWTKRDMSKLTPQRQRHYDRLSKITGRDYSTRIPGMRINLSADALARFGKFQDAGWYKGITKAFPGIKSLRINKQLYSNPIKKGWHSSQRTGRGQGLKDIPMRDMMMRPEDYERMSSVRAHPSQDIGMMYQNILGRKADQEGLDYWTNEFISGKSTMDDIRRNIVRSKEFQGRSDADKRSALHGIKKRRAARGEKVGVSAIIDELNRRGIRHSKTALPPRRRGGGGPIGSAISAGIGLLGNATKVRRAKQHHRQKVGAAQKSYNLQAKGMKRRNKQLIANTLAATMAARGI